MSAIDRGRALMAKAEPKPWHHFAHMDDGRYYGIDMRGADWKAASWLANHADAMLDIAEAAKQLRDAIKRRDGGISGALCVSNLDAALARLDGGGDA